MQKSSQLNRRSMLSASAALATTIGISGTAFARTGMMSLESTADWKTGTADDFAPLVNQPFMAKLKDGTLLHLTLVDVEASNSGAARPKHLARSEGVTLTFKSDFAEDLAKQGDHTVWIFNHALGNFEAFLGTTPRRTGGYDIELILN
ncbi:MAG: hypothetical protein ABJO36_06080 [Litorimonas sp.]